MRSSAKTGPGAAGTPDPPPVLHPKLERPTTPVLVFESVCEVLIILGVYMCVTCVSVSAHTDSRKQLSGAGFLLHRRFWELNSGPA